MNGTDRRPTCRPSNRVAGRGSAIPPTDLRHPGDSERPPVESGGSIDRGKGRAPLVPSRTAGISYGGGRNPFGCEGSYRR